MIIPRRIKTVGLAPLDLKRQSYVNGGRAVSKNKITIREMGIEDYEKVLSLWQGVEGIELSDSDNKDEMSIFLGRNIGLSFLAEEALEENWLTVA